jgi:signal transduction histidine kinase
MKVDKLRVLIVEDSEADELLLIRELRRGGLHFESERVQTAEEMHRALASHPFDVILADFVLPNFGAQQALAVMKQRSLDLPFVIVSGKVDDHVAVEMMRAGAHDFLSKDKLARLVPAVLREVREATLRRESLRLQEQLLISERMASVGMLAAGVAHELNNPLTVVTANLAFACQQLALLQSESVLQCESVQLAEIGRFLREAVDAAERMRLIVRDLKIFSRLNEEVHSSIDLREVLDTALRLAKNEIRHRVRLVKHYGEISLIEGNELRLGQALLNVIVNALQSIPEGQPEPSEVRVVTRQAGPDHVIVEVSDTGSGIPPEHLSRIFDPFFSTKPIGEGTGLGLAITHRIITGLGGTIEVESSVGNGTLVRMTLPTVAKRSLTPAASTVSAPRSLPQELPQELPQDTACRCVAGSVPRWCCPGAESQSTGH